MDSGADEGAKNLLLCFVGGGFGDDAEPVAFGVELPQVLQLGVTQILCGSDGDSHGLVVSERKVDAVDSELSGAAGDGAANNEVGLPAFGGGDFAVLPVESGGRSEDLGNGFLSGESYGLGTHVAASLVGGENAAYEGRCLGNNPLETLNIDGIYADSHNHEVPLPLAGTTAAVVAASPVLSLASFHASARLSVKYDAFQVF